MFRFSNSPLLKIFFFYLSDKSKSQLFAFQMGSKKRSNSESSEEVEKNQTDDGFMKKKKSKTDSMKNVVNADDTGTAAATGAASSGKDMEKKKKRKASDKERKRAALENDDEASRPKPVVTDSKSNDPETSIAAASSSSSSSLPELPLNYFRDLASSDASVREAAAESVVLRLQEIQKQYEMLPDKESVDGGLMLEAEKNDGLDNCAPQLRYALRRLIRGVSSSREVSLLLAQFLYPKILRFF